MPTIHHEHLPHHLEWIYEDGVLKKRRTEKKIHQNSLGKGNKTSERNAPVSLGFHFKFQSCVMVRTVPSGWFVGTPWQNGK